MADVYQLIVGAKLCGQPVENVLHYEHTATADPDPQIRSQNVINGFQAQMEAAWLGVLPQNYILIGYKAKRVNNGGGPTVIELAAGGTTGGQAANANESCISPVIVLSYSNGVRWFAGRIFMPGIDDTNIDDNQYSPGIKTLYDTLNGLWGTPLASGGDTLEFVVWSPTHSVAYEPVAYTLSEKPGTQRRRLVPTF